MKIAIFGNTNNIPLVLADAFRALGHQAELIVNETSLLHRPESMFPHYRNGYPDWIHDFSDIDEEHFISASSRILPVLEILNSADAVILNSLGPSLHDLLDPPAIAWLTGSDLDYLANFETLAVRRHGCSEAFALSQGARLDYRNWTRFIERQRTGILRSRAVSYFHRGLVPHGDAILDDIGVPDARRFFMYSATHLDEKPNREHGNQVPRLFCGARLTWKLPIASGSTPLDYKGADVLVRGVAEYFRKTGAPVELRLVKKGRHVEDTSQLVEREGIGSLVTWLDEMDMVTFIEELKNADVCVDHLSQSVVGMAGLDAMAMGKPLIANSRADVWARFIDKPLPICHAETPTQVCDQLERLLSSPKERAAVGATSRAFVRKYWTPRASAKACLERLKR